MNLPKVKDGISYLSYSQISSFLKDKKDYIERYFLNEPISFTKYIDFGKDVGKALEENDFSNFDEKDAKFLASIPRLAQFERKINIDFGDFKIVGYIDTADDECTHIIDYKTGGLDKKKEYTKDEYIQILIYAIGLYQEYGKYPKKGEIILIERLGNAFKGEPLILGTQYERIDIPITEERIEYAKKLVMDTAKEIEKYYNVFLKLNK